MSLQQNDLTIFEAIEKEKNRQHTTLELIASENFVSEDVLEAMGSVMTNKYAEGYPGKRYYGGCEFVDVAEQAAIERSNEAVWMLNMQMFSHTQVHRQILLYFSHCFSLVIK